MRTKNDMDEEERKRLDALAKAQTDSRNLMIALMALYVVLVIVMAVVGVLSYRRVNTMARLSQKANAAVTAAKESGILQSMLKGASDIVKAQAASAVQEMQEQHQHPKPKPRRKR